MSQVKEQIAPAIIQALILCIVRFFTIPWRIWKGAAFRLATMRQYADSGVDKSATTEFPVFDWFRSAWDGIIFLSWFVGALMAVLAFLGTTFSVGFFSGIGSAIGVLISSYFAVIFMSFFKESLILLLSIALNVEKLATEKKLTENSL